MKGVLTAMNDKKKTQKEKKRGRPPIANPRKNNYRLRMNYEEKALLDEASIITGLSTSDVLREGVKRLIEEERRRGIDVD